MELGMSGWKYHSSVTVIALAVAILSLLPNNVMRGGWSWSQDWMWFIVAIAGVAIIRYSCDSIEISSPVRIFTIIPLVLQIILTQIRLLEANDALWISSLVLQTWAATAFGYILAVALDRKAGVKISNSWRLLFALMFACAFGGLYIFFMFANLWFTGYPVYNYDLILFADRIEMNKRLMTPPMVATFGSIIATVFLRALTKKPKEISP
jgi:hypothetical protein